MKIIHAADLHLDSPLRGLAHYEGAPTEDVRLATRRAFAALIDRCLAEHVAYLLIAGDLYDGDFKDYATALYFVQQVARLREINTQVIWLRGNHDAANRMTRHLQVADHVHELSIEQAQSLIFEGDGIAVHGQGYSARDIQDDLSKNYPAPLPGLFNIGLLHTSMDGRPGHAPYAPCSLSALRNHGYDYWALGHVHKREVLCEEPWILFPGNLQGRHIRETGEKGCSLITLENGRVQSVAPLVLDQVRWEVCEVSVTDAQTVDDIIEASSQKLALLRASAGGRVLATRLSLFGQTPAHAVITQAKVRIENELRALAIDCGDVYLQSVQFRTLGQVTAEALVERHDALGELFQAISELGGDETAKSAIWDEIVKPLSSVSADLLRDDFLDRDEILAEAAQLLQGRLLYGEEPG